MSENDPAEVSATALGPIRTIAVRNVLAEAFNSLFKAELVRHCVRALRGTSCRTPAAPSRSRLPRSWWR